MLTAVHDLRRDIGGDFNRHSAKGISAEGVAVVGNHPEAVGDGIRRLGRCEGNDGIGVAWGKHSEVGVTGLKHVAVGVDLGPRVGDWLALGVHGGAVKSEQRATGTGHDLGWALAKHRHLIGFHIHRDGANDLGSGVTVGDQNLKPQGEGIRDIRCVEGDHRSVGVGKHHKLGVVLSQNIAILVNLGPGVEDLLVIGIGGRCIHGHRAAGLNPTDHLILAIGDDRSIVGIDEHREGVLAIGNAVINAQDEHQLGRTGGSDECVGGGKGIVGIGELHDRAGLLDPRVAEQLPEVGVGG